MPELLRLPDPVERLAAALRYRTVSAAADLTAFQAFLATQFPLSFAHAVVQRPSPHRLVLILEPGTTNEPPPRVPPPAAALFLAHYDVVDAPNEEQWTHPPFGGTIADGWVWGRGALDDKGPLMALLEAFESLLETELTAPAALGRRVIIALGGDEETGGQQGAAQTAAELAAAGTPVAMVLDEGAIVARGMLSLVRRPVALIGVAEKGIVDFLLTAQGAGGHASMPPRQTALGALSRAIDRVERHPARPALTATAAAFLRALAPHVGGGLRALLARPRLFAPLLLRALSRIPSTNAMIRTTVAPTMARASFAPNVLTAEAQAVLNVRILPGESVAGVRQRLQSRIGNLPVTVTILPQTHAAEPMPESPTDSPWYRLVAEAAGSTFPETIVVPYLVTATTDSRHFRDLAPNTYRFVPFELDAELLATIHGTDERVSIAMYHRAIAFYTTLLRAARYAPPETSR